MNRVAMKLHVQVLFEHLFFFNSFEHVYFSTLVYSLLKKKKKTTLYDIYFLARHDFDQKFLGRKIVWVCIKKDLACQA